MGTLLKLLPMELSELKPKDFIDACSDLEKGEKAIGEMSDEEKRLHTLWRRAVIEGKKLKAELELLSDEDRERTIQQLLILDKRVRILKELFWYTVNEDHHLWSLDNIGIRRGFKIVTFKGQPNPLQGLFRLGRFMPPSGDEPE